ncbi:MAG TPA: response regulator [Noviherbaspirillum sp.]
MSTQFFPFAVRLLGFSSQEEREIDGAFEAGYGKGYGYIRLTEGNLQDPDLYVADAANIAALAALSHLHPSTVRPASLVGQAIADLPFARIDRPLDMRRLVVALDELVEKRADVLSQLEASDIVPVPERRRSQRLDLDLTDPAEYEKMRTKAPENGAVLVVDRSPALRDYLSDLLARQNVPVVWTDGEAEAVEICKRQPVAVVMINTSTPGIDPYRLSWAIKEKNSPVRIAVVFLTSKPFVYDLQQAGFVGADGFLNKPLASHHIIAVLKKFMPSVR